MRTSFLRERSSVIIGALLLALAALLAGCSTPKLAYQNAPQLAWWWLDRYAGFDGAHAPQVRATLDRYFDWHRATQLPAYARLLSEAQTAALQPTSGEAVCRWQERIEQALQPALDRFLADAAEQVPRLAEPQFRQMEQRFAKVNAEARRDFLQPDLAQRARAALERARERAENFYGRLSPAQLQVLEAGLKASPFDPAAWLAERERRQRETLQTLRRLAAPEFDGAQRLGALKEVSQRWDLSADPAYRAYRDKLGAYNCALTAQLHNAATPEQRRKAADKLRSWEGDLRALAGAAAQ